MSDCPSCRVSHDAPAESPLHCPSCGEQLPEERWSDDGDLNWFKVCPDGPPFCRSCHRQLTAPFR